ncbi:hypothetical protein OG709_27905 [Streptomyces sp. NBC_01267]|uniref:hypothetical protein n=1 Tax=Streptomyces sp. NBC_01267 TaxID=2903805 RepID=UPI002E35F93C|nr:hypothetical protein [Streptomyces sp. NBC_01267]
MNDLTAKLSQEQTVLLNTMAQQYLMEGVWPVWSFTVATLDNYDLEAEKLIRSLPRVGSQGNIGISYGLTSQSSPYLADDDRPSLTIAACLHLPELQPYMSEPFLRVLHVLIGMHRSAHISTQEAARPRFTIDDIKQELPGLPESFAARLPGVLALEPATWGGSSGGTAAAGTWWRELRREIRRYKNAKTLHDYVQTTARLVAAQANEIPGAATIVPVPVSNAVPGPGPYVDEALIADLKAKNTVLQLDKLLALVGELNTNHADRHPYACQMLLRAILDHVPPAFGLRTFEQVVANVAFGKTDKAYIRKLTDFRNSADDALHRPMSTRPSRLSMDDLPPRTYINALLQNVLDSLRTVPQPTAPVTAP